MITLRFTARAAFVLSLAVLPAFAQDTVPAPSPSASAPSAVAPSAAKVDPDLEGKFEERAAKIMGLLSLADAEAAKRIHDAIVAHYVAINQWHGDNDAKIASLKKPVPGAAKPSDDAKAEIARRTGQLLQIHATFVAALAKDLNPGQVEQVKDELTYGKVKFTYEGYLRVYPTLSDADKAVVLSFLKQAREDGIDGSNVAQKNAIFGVYKGRIQNYLSQHGYATKPGTKAGAPKAPSTSQPPANPS